MPDLADARPQPNPVLGFRVTPKLLADIERWTRDSRSGDIGSRVHTIRGTDLRFRE